MRRNVACRRFRHSCPLLLILAVCCLVAMLPCSASAQNQAAPHVQVQDGTATIGAWPSGEAVLTDGWRFHLGDNADYAKPDFDDSAWQTVHIRGFRKGRMGVSWYRLHVVVSPQHGPLALNVIALKGTYQVYVNGRLLPEPHLLPVLLDRLSIETIPLPAVGNEFDLAIRCVNPRMMTGRAPLDLVVVGSLPLMSAAAANRTSALIGHRTASLPIEIACILVGLAMLGLFYFQRGHKEYMWLGLYLITIGSSYGVFWTSSFMLLPMSANILYGDPTTYLFTLFQIEFTFAFIQQKVSRRWRAYEMLLALSSVGAVVFNALGMLDTPYYIAYEIFATLPATLILPVLLWIWYRKGNREAGLLVIPSIFPGLAGVLNNASFVASFGFNWHGLDFLARPILVGPLGFQLVDLSNFVFLLAIGVVIFLRFTEVSRAEARTAAELDAAREIQQTLVPAEPPAVEGYQLAAAYIPATQVGGDFYQVLPQPDGGTIVALGDVSGKGLKAAMTGTLAIGALRSLAARGLSPAALLADLNEEIVAAQKGGFITMLCARIEANGKVTLANAGHLHPYRSGKEIELEAGLPLGVTSGITYTEREITLQPGERLTLLSDGVVEARNKDGELFGFDRTQAGSGATAQQMAEAAQQFGQEDDITVLTLTREGAAATETVPMPADPLPSQA